MGLISSIPKLVVKYGGKIIKGGKTALNYSGRAIKASPYIIFGNEADTFVKAAGNVTKAADESWFKAMGKAIKSGGKAVEENIAKASAKEGNILKQAWNAIKTTPKAISVYTRRGAGLAKAAGKSTLAGGFKGFFKGVASKMPLVGNLLLVGMCLPNIIKATKEQGIFAGLKETAKTGIELAGASIGGAIGAAALGPIGMFIGFAVGDWLTCKIVGKSYTEKKEEQEEKAAETYASVNQMQSQQPSFTSYPYYNYSGIYNPYGSDYSNDIMMPQTFNMYA